MRAILLLERLVVRERLSIPQAPEHGLVLAILEAREVPVAGGLLVGAQLVIVGARREGAARLRGRVV